jgi:zinc protease
MNQRVESPPGSPAAPDRSTAPQPGPLRPFHFPPIERFTLSNGLPVIVATLPGLPVATLSLLLDAGGLHEAPSRAGLASLTAGLLESGAGSRSGAEVADALERIGVQLGVGTSWDTSHLDLTGLTGRLSEAAGILTELVRGPTFPEEEVGRLRQEQLGAILQRKADPRALANEMAARFIFSEESPFSRPLGGTRETVAALTRDDVAAFHAEHFSPAAASLVIAGDLSAEQARALAEEHFGAWTGPAPPPAAAVVRPREEGVQLVVVDRPGSVQSEIRVGHVGVPRDTDDYFPLAVMNSILGGAFSSRLNLNLRERHGFTYGVSSSFVMRRLPGPFAVSTAVQTEVTAAALTEILREIRAIRAEPVSESELNDARNLLAGIFPLRLQTTEGVAARLAELAVYALPLDYFDSYRERILAVTREEVRRAAQLHLRPDQLTIVVVGDASRVRDSLEGVGVGPVRVVQGTEET